MLALAWGVRAGTQPVIVVGNLTAASADVNASSVITGTTFLLEDLAYRADTSMSLSGAGARLVVLAELSVPLLTISPGGLVELHGNISAKSVVVERGARLRIIGTESAFDVAGAFVLRGSLELVGRSDAVVGNLTLDAQAEYVLQVTNGTVHATLDVRDTAAVDAAATLRLSPGEVLPSDLVLPLLRYASLAGPGFGFVGLVPQDRYNASRALLQASFGADAATPSCANGLCTARTYVYRGLIVVESTATVDRDFLVSYIVALCLVFILIAALAFWSVAIAREADPAMQVLRSQQRALVAASKFRRSVRTTLAHPDP